LHEHINPTGSEDNDSIQIERNGEPRYFGKQRWFRKPLKVQVVPGILVPHPVVGTHGKHPGGGESSGKRDPESGHSLLTVLKYQI